MITIPSWNFFWIPLIPSFHFICYVWKQGLMHSVFGNLVIATREVHIIIFTTSILSILTSEESWNLLNLVAAFGSKFRLLDLKCKLLMIGFRHRLLHTFLIDDVIFENIYTILRQPDQVRFPSISRAKSDLSEGNIVSDDSDGYE